MKKQSTKPFRMAPLQRLTVRPIEDPAEQAALDELLKRGEESASGVSAPTSKRREAKVNTPGKKPEGKKGRAPVDIDTAIGSAPFLLLTNDEAKAHRRAAGQGRSDSPPTRGEPDLPTAGRRHQSAEFRGDPEPGGAVQSRARKPRTDAGRGRPAHGHRRAGSVPLGNRRDAEPPAGISARLGLSVFHLPCEPLGFCESQVTCNW